jgi:outer membrane biosynthesis protein TonB
MHPSRPLTQHNGQQRYRALAMLGALVLGVHLWLLWAPNIGIWKIQADPQKLGPLQTRLVPTPSPAEPRPQAQPPAQTKPKLRPKPRPQQASMSPNTLPPASITAMPSEALPAPEPTPVPDIELAVTSAPAQAEPVPVPETPSMAAETSLPTAQASPPASNALTAKTGDFPPNIQINYKLVGQERGFLYHASGSLKWQAQVANDKGTPRAYEAELQVRAFLVGSRVWRSTGSLTDKGLAPLRYADRWRGERAAHFETESQKISFSGNLPSAPLLPGAQDQVSLFIQMAAAVSAQNFKTGAELMIQTATARDAVNWTLTYKADEFIEVNGDRLETQRWLCLPRGKFDSQIEMWLSQKHGGMPVRIKITQSSGSFIDLEMNSSEALSALTP